jgi:isoleucyl-tRNA synthetase
MQQQYKTWSNLQLPQLEKEVAEQWKQQNAFEQSISLREGAPSFVFYEGPPSANGMPGIHHVISRTLKDLVCRYKTMKGFQVKRKGGWDTHGLPIELGVEKELGITKEDIGKRITVEEYNKKCREAVLRFKDKWDDITNKMGYWVDLNNPYITFENNYIESLWWLLQKMYNRGLLYESVSIQPYSPAAGTGLSSHELNQPGTYKDVKDTSATVMFKAIKNDNSSFLFEKTDGNDVYIMAWTTTPWTLPSNLGLTVGPNVEYVLVKTYNPYIHVVQYVVLAKALLHKYFKADFENGDFDAYAKDGKNIPYAIVSSFTGKQLVNIRYQQLLPFVANSMDKVQEITPNADPFKIIPGDFVTTEDGTGIVHTAPAFGADDYKVGKQHNLGILTLVDRQGKFVDGVGEYSNRYVKNYKDDKDYVDVNVDIAVALKLAGQAFKVEKYEHNYPHCWRTDKPILYYPLDAWFIKTTALQDRMVKLNENIQWKPESTGTGRFGKWLENIQDWNLSRSRFWGTPLPIWKTEDGEEQTCIGSIKELQAEIKKAGEVLGGDTNRHYLHNGILDLHKPYVDDIVLVSPTGKPMKRVPDLIDVWFDSGAMPYAQHHFPFENVAEFAKNYPASFIAEGVDQTRGWFYTLHAIAALVKEDVAEVLQQHGFEKEATALQGNAYNTVVSNGLVLDKDGNKMSKRLGNVIDPFDTIATYGADATRWYLVTNASPWDNLKFDIKGIQEVQRKFFGTLFNTYQFFAMYANVDGFSFKEAYIPLAERPEIDRWIVSSLHTLINNVTKAFDDYEPTQAGRFIEDFVDENLSNWWVRLCRKRFWRGEYEHDKIAAYQTLYECLEVISLLMAPIAPFFSDVLYGNLNTVTKRLAKQSVHHDNYPIANSAYIDMALEERMDLAKDASSLVLSIRKKTNVNIKVRQPLQKVLIPALNEQMKWQLQKVEDIIKAEVNVKEIDYLEAGNDFIKKKAKANFKVLGQRLGSKMKEVAGIVSAFTSEDIKNFEQKGAITVKASDNTEFGLSTEDIEIIADEIPGWQVANKGNLTLALDITISEALKAEGFARELINRIQTIRKESGFEITDKINVEIMDNNGDIKNFITQFKFYICDETLSESVEFVSTLEGIEPIDVNDYQVFIKVNKKG